MYSTHFLNTIFTPNDFKAAELEAILPAFKQLKFAKNDFLLQEGKTENH
jgi:hypothetical protein